MLEREDDPALMEGETMITDPVTGERCVQLTPEDAADLNAAIVDANTRPTRRIDDIEAYLDDVQARVERRRLGDGAMRSRHE